jgi:hypothetical protein
MPDVALTEMDLAVLTCLLHNAALEAPGIEPIDLEPCLQELFPGYDETAMREGESLTRLRGRQLVAIDVDGGVYLTSLGRQMAEGLDMDSTPGG